VPKERKRQIIPNLQSHKWTAAYNYKQELKSNSKQPSFKKVCSPQEKAMMKKDVNKRWHPRSGCDGRFMEKLLITTIQVNLVSNPSEMWRR